MARLRFASSLACILALALYAGNAHAGFYFLTPTGPTDVGAFGVVTFEVFYTSDGDVDPDPGPLDPDNIFSAALRFGLSDLGVVATVTANTTDNPFFIPVLNQNALPAELRIGGSEIAGDGLEPIAPLKLGEVTLTGTGASGSVELETISTGAIFPSTNDIPDTTAAEGGVRARAPSRLTLLGSHYGFARSGRDPMIIVWLEAMTAAEDCRSLTASSWPNALVSTSGMLKPCQPSIWPQFWSGMMAKYVGAAGPTMACDAFHLIGLFTFFDASASFWTNASYTAWPPGFSVIVMTWTSGGGPSSWDCAIVGVSRATATPIARIRRPAIRIDTLLGRVSCPEKPEQARHSTRQELRIVAPTSLAQSWKEYGHLDRPALDYCVRLSSIYAVSEREWTTQSSTHQTRLVRPQGTISAAHGVIRGSGRGVGEESHIRGRLATVPESNSPDCVHKPQFASPEPPVVLLNVMPVRTQALGPVGGPDPASATTKPRLVSYRRAVGSKISHSDAM